MLQAATRARGLIVRCSNDGIAISPPLVLTRDEASDTVELNRELLRRQFELE